MNHSIFDSLLVAKIISDLPFWKLDNEWQRVFLLIVLSILLFAIIWSKRKEPSAWKTQDGSNQE